MDDTTVREFQNLAEIWYTTIHRVICTWLEKGIELVLCLCSINIFALPLLKIDNSFSCFYMLQFSGV